MAHQNYYIRPLDVGGNIVPVPAEAFYAASLAEAMKLARLRWPGATLVTVRKSSKIRRPVK